jgi:nucleotide-binding universal stress UspA family protein
LVVVATNEPEGKDKLMIGPGRSVGCESQEEAMPHTDAAATLEHLARATAQSDSANRRETSRTIIVAADGSSLADQALAFAAPVARGWGGQLVLVRAAARIDPSVLSGAESLVAAATHELSELARTADELGRRADLLRSDGVVAAARIGVGEPSAVILDAARSANADLIVMGTRRSSGLRRWWHGSIADRVLRAAEAPVVVVPDRWQGWQHPQHGRHILVPLDGSAVAEQALRPARALAAALHARMVSCGSCRRSEPLSLDMASALCLSCRRRPSRRHGRRWNWSPLRCEPMANL